MSDQLTKKRKRFDTAFKDLSAEEMRLHLQSMQYRLAGWQRAIPVLYDCLGRLDHMLFVDALAGPSPLLKGEVMYYIARLQDNEALRACAALPSAPEDENVLWREVDALPPIHLLDILPNEIMCRIFSLLNVHELPWLALVCRRFYQVCRLVDWRATLMSNVRTMDDVLTLAAYQPTKLHITNLNPHLRNMLPLIQSLRVLKLDLSLDQVAFASGSVKRQSSSWIRPSSGQSDECQGLAKAARSTMAKGTRLLNTASTAAGRLPDAATQAQLTGRVETLRQKLRPEITACEEAYVAAQATAQDDEASAAAAVEQARKAHATLTTAIDDAERLRDEAKRRASGQTPKRPAPDEDLNEDNDETEEYEEDQEEEDPTIDDGVYQPQSHTRSKKKRAVRPPLRLSD